MTTRLLLLAALFHAGTAFAESGPLVEPRAAELLEAMSETLRAAPAWTVHAEVVYDDVVRGGRKLQFSAELDAALRRPDGLYLDYRGDLGVKQLWYDGKTFTLLDLLARVFVKEPAPATTSAMLAKVTSEQSLDFPLADFVADDPYAVLSAGARSGFVVGPGDVNGR